MADRPHFAFPFQRGADGSVGVVEQGTPEHVMSCENVIVRCPVGFRIERPEFGIPWPEYRSKIDPDELTAAMRQFEPRSTLRGSVLLALFDASQSEVTIEVETHGG
jgi:phage baseplate assembly protein W